MTKYGVMLVMLAAGLLSPGVAEAQVNIQGKIQLLRVHDVGTKFGPPTDQIDVEVVVILQNAPDRAFGFQLRNDANRPVRQGMLDVLRDAFANNSNVAMDFMAPAGKKNGVIIRVWEFK
ncbi:MAG TPA: hypothetical protein VNV86_10070 [Candidatus Acidoferrum sp.]|jgi:hypothetical protein|nr:hypothetical protein [Candidatus Acidoferrum sp.]